MSPTRERVTYRSHVAAFALAEAHVQPPPASLLTAVRLTNNAATGVSTYDDPTGVAIPAGQTAVLTSN